MTNPLRTFPIVILISGNGSNLQAMLDARAHSPFLDIRAVVSNKSDAYGIIRAEEANVPAFIIPHENFPVREEFDRALQDRIDYFNPSLVVLAGFMRRLGHNFVKHYHGRLINIHPSLLPRYQGLHTHRRALADGVREHGTTVHFVSDELDSGPIICQASLEVSHNDTEASLQKRVQLLEHIMYPQVLEWFALGRISLSGSEVLFDGKVLDTHGIQISPKLA